MFNQNCPHVYIDMKKYAVFVAVAFVMVLSASGVTRSPKSEISKNLDVFSALYKELQTFYVDSIDAERSIGIAIEAMLDDIDPYTEYIPAKAQEQFRQLTTGEYAGIGSMIMERSGQTYVSEPYEGSPAQLAGLRPGDHIIMVDGDSTLGWSSSKVSERLKGQAGTVVRVVVDRPWVGDSILTFDITRRKIQIPSVPYWGMVDGGVGYIKLNSFTEKSFEEVRQAVASLLREDEAKGLVLDLRGNGGGLVESAVQILGLFLPKGTEVLVTRGKDALTEKIYKTQVVPIDTKVPLAVLVDGQTASASEIVSGALQDLDRAVVIGNRSFGKGLVQSTRQLPYDGLLKVTVAKYYIPSGRLIQAIDYSHRNPDGSVARIPDSLTNVFHTAGGREVRDGGGITPDVNIDYPEVTRLTYNVVRDNWSFDFATKYAAEHASIPSPEQFEVTDSIYDAFMEFIDPDKFDYDKVCETALEQLRKIATTEGYMNDSTKMEFDRMAQLLHHDLRQDLVTNRKALSPYIANDIINRYYHNRGEIVFSLREDPAVEEAVVILTTPRYIDILKPGK